MSVVAGRGATFRLVEAFGIRESQKIISDGLTPSLLRWQAIQAFRELAASSNSKVIITDGDTPLIVLPETTGAASASAVPSQ